MFGFLLQTVRMLRFLGRVLAEPEGRVLGALVATQLAVGTIFYSLVEGWRWIDAIYFSVTTLATVGLGDIAPATDAGKLFTVMYILTGVGLLVSFLNFMAERAAARKSSD
jgi:voltage-gated potassium channel